MINKKTLVKTWGKIIIGLLVIALVVALYFQWLSSFDLGKPKYSDSVVVEDSTGEEFRITRAVYTFPDFDVMLFVFYKGEEIYSSYSFDHANDFENDIVKNFHKIESEYHLDDTHAYLFPWGIIYSLDGRKTFSCVPEDEYSLTCRSDEVFAGIYEELAKQTA